MQTSSPVRTGLASLLLLAAAAPAAASPKPGAGPLQRIEIRYGISLIGLPIGTAAIVGSLGPKSYRLEAAGKLTGLAGVIVNSKGAATSSGSFVEGHAVPAGFAASAANRNAVLTIRMSEAKGAATGVEITPPYEQKPDRVPLTEADKHNILDPLSSFFMPVPGEGEMAGPAACNRTLPLFDGGVRFDVVLAFSGTREVDGPGYKGPVAVCSARYKPHAGHRPDRQATKYMMDNKEMSVWLAPLVGTRYVVPYRISVLSMIGTVVVEATNFKTEPDIRAAAGAR